jgi:hypothetical protein
MKQQSVWKKNNTKRSKPKQRAAFVEQQSVWKKKQQTKTTCSFR